MKKTQHLTKNSLLAEATQQFSEHGFSEASVRSICKEVGVSVAAINYHFGNKNNLVTTVIENSMEKFLDALDESLNESHVKLSEFLFSYGMKLSYFKKEILITFRNMFTSSLTEAEFNEKISKVMKKLFECADKVAQKEAERSFSEEELKERVELFNSVVTLEVLRRNLMPNQIDYPAFENWLRKQIDFILRD